MDLSPGMMLSGLFIGSVGMGMLVYGKKRGDGKCLLAGIAMSVAPFFGHSLAVMWLIAAGCAAALYGASKWM